jgi:hypothetical protein
MLLQMSKHRGRLLAPFFDYVESGGVTGIAGFLPVDNGGRDPVVPRSSTTALVDQPSSRQ